MTTQLNPNAIVDHSITAVKLANDAIVSDASIAAMGYTKNQGTITGITMNGESQGTAGVVNLGNVVTGNAKIFYGTCDTSAATVDKVVTCEAFTAEDLVKGALIFVTFDYTNSGAVASLTLNVNSTGAMPIKKSYTGTAVSDLTNAGELKSNVTYLFTYDNTNWVCITLDYNTNSTYSAMSVNEITAGTGTTGRLMTPARLRAYFYTETEVDSLLDTKADASAAIGSLSLGINSSNYQITLSGTKVDGTPFTVDSVIDLPLESVVVDGSYNNATKKVVLTLQSGSTVEFSVADLVAGLQSEITSTNKLSADLIQDGATNKTVTATEKSTWSGKQDAISDLATIRENASIGAAKVSNVQSDWNATTGLAVILNKPTIPAAPGTLNTNNTTAQTASASEALSGIVNLHKVAKTGTYSDLIGTPTIPTVNNATLTIQKNGTNVQTFTANASSNVTANITVNELPTVTSSDNGKVLMVVNGAWAATTPVSIYSGSDAPNNSQGINGDLYLQI